MVDCARAHVRRREGSGHSDPDPALTSEQVRAAAHGAHVGAALSCGHVARRAAKERERGKQHSGPRVCSRARQVVRQRLRSLICVGTPRSRSHKSYLASERSKCPNLRAASYCSTALRKSFEMFSGAGAYAGQKEGSRGVGAWAFGAEAFPSHHRGCRTRAPPRVQGCACPPPLDSRLRHPAARVEQRHVQRRHRERRSLHSVI